MRIIAFGDDYGIPQLIRHLPEGMLVGFVAAGIRPQQHAQLRRLAEEYGPPLLIQPKASSPDYQDFVLGVRSLRPDLILASSYSMLLRPEILTIPLHGAVNIHGAMLPNYRGSNPIQWALLNQETETGVTMHYMTAEFDDGDIIAQRRVPMYFEDTWRDIQARIASATEAMLAEELPKLLNGTGRRQPQDKLSARQYPRRHPEDGRIDWRQSVVHIYNLIRALVKPHPGAFYGDSTDKVVLDQYLTIPQVTSLKYSGAGGQMLVSAHISLSPLGLTDLPVVCEWMDDRQRARFNAPDKCPVEGEDEAWLETIFQHNDLVVFGIRPLGSDRLIGLCHLHSIDYTRRSADLHTRLGDRAEGNHGYAEDATRLLLDFAFRDLMLHRVYLHVFSNNSVAIRMYEKVGFVRERVLREAAHIDGHYVDVIVMGISREQYVAA